MILDDRLSLKRLVVPILGENLLRMTLSSIDIFMLSLYNDQAVAAVGLANQYVMFLMLIYSVVGTGASIVLAQTLGAGRRNEADRLATAALVMATVFALVMSALAVTLAGPILSLYRLEPAVREYALQYMVIYGAGSFFVAFNVVQAGILRTTGNAREVMTVNIGANLVNIAGNYLAIRGLSLGPLAIPVTGVAGVAVSTVASQVVACGVFARMMGPRAGVHPRFSLVRELKMPHLRPVLEVGIPVAGEGLAYNIAQILLMNMAASLGTSAMSAWVYNLTCMRFAFAGAMSIAQATQIQVGHLTGGGDNDQADRMVWKHYLAGVSLSFGLAVLINLAGEPLLGILTRDGEVVGLARKLMLVSILLEIGRASNLVVIHGLKGAGDVRFPVFTGMLSMWGIGVMGGWFMGIHLKLGVAGIWAGVAADEFLRGIIMLLRWKSRAWVGKAKPAGALPPVEAVSEALPGVLPGGTDLE